MAVGGELRYARPYLDELPTALEPFFKEVSETQRGKAWLVWTVIRRKYGINALALAEEAFYMRGWRRNFGGVAWAQVACALRNYLEGKRKPRIFVDQCFNLEHNTGSVFNKLYNVSGLPAVLEAHGQDDYPTLAPLGFGRGSLVIDHRSCWSTRGRTWVYPRSPLDSLRQPGVEKTSSASSIARI